MIFSRNLITHAYYKNEYVCVGNHLNFFFFKYCISFPIAYGYYKIIAYIIKGICDFLTRNARGQAF